MTSAPAIVANMVIKGIAILKTMLFTAFFANGAPPENPQSLCGSYMFMSASHPGRSLAAGILPFPFWELLTNSGVDYADWQLGWTPRFSNY
jgi:hypothetical protein